MKADTGYGMAMEFDGESYVDCSNDAILDITGPISIGIWIRLGTDGSLETTEKNTTSAISEEIIATMACETL